MTKTKRRTNADRNYDTVNSLKSEIQMWMRQHFSSARTFEDILAWRQRVVFDHPRYSKLTIADREALRMVFELEIRSLEHKLAGTNVFDGQRYFCNDPVFREFSPAEVHFHQEQLKSEGKAVSALCYTFCTPDKTLLFIPYRADERELELESGRLTDENLKLIYHKDTVQLFVTPAPGGRGELAVVKFAKVNGGKVELP